jgi:hypothetical protein
MNELFITKIYFLLKYHYHQTHTALVHTELTTYEDSLIAKIFSHVSMHTHTKQDRKRKSPWVCAHPVFSQKEVKDLLQKINVLLLQLYLVGNNMF